MVLFRIFREIEQPDGTGIFATKDGMEQAPVSDEELLRLNPFAVTFRYDDMDIELIEPGEVVKWVTDLRHWAEKQVDTAAKTEEA